MASQPIATPQMNMFDQLNASYDEFAAEAFEMGKNAYDAKGVIPKKSGQWTSGYIGIHNPIVCCLSCKIFVN